MPARLWLALVLLPSLAAMVQAGAWPRERGEVFLSLSTQVDARDENGVNRQSYGLYAEYGATDRLTVGLDLNGDALRMSKAVGFLRWPLGRAERPLKLAVELGAGQVEDEAALRPGLAFGRGVPLGRHHGWLNGDLRAILFAGGGSAVELELTAGLSLGQRLKLIAQVQAGSPGAGRDYLRLAPSLAYRIRAGTRLELGVLAPLSGGGERGLKLGIWREF